MKVYARRNIKASSLVVRPTMGKFAVFQMCGKDRADILFKGTEDECYEWIENNKDKKKPVKAGYWGRDSYFGKEQAEQYGDLIADKLAGKTISKRVDISEEPGGLVYEADRLGIDKWDLLEALEGMCYQGRAREIDDSTYKVMASRTMKSVKASVDEDDRYELIERKSIKDSDGFMTEYSMYFDHEEGRYVFVYGDSDIYYPEDEDFDYECEDINEAYEWFESYNGFEDPAELEIGSIVSADGLILKFMGQVGDMYKFKPMDDRTRNLLMEVDERYDPDDDCIYLDIEDVESSIYW